MNHMKDCSVNLYVISVHTLLLYPYDFIIRNFASDCSLVHEKNYSRLMQMIGYWWLMISGFSISLKALVLGYGFRVGYVIFSLNTYLHQIPAFEVL